MRKLSITDNLANEFLQKAKTLKAEVELIKVLKSRTYKIAEANVLIRAASEGNKTYFFGINYITCEEMANLDNPFIAFICGSLDKTIIIPANILFKNLPQISHDRNGEYKININKNLNIALSGRNNRLDCHEYINAWETLLTPSSFDKEKNTVEESLHSVLQGRLVEIGNFRGFQTFCPNKSKIFNGKKLGEISTLESCPPLQFSDHEILRQIDVLWFRAKGKNFLPECAFEVKLSTGTWSGVGRLTTLIDYQNVGLYVISNNIKKYKQVMDVFADNQKHYRHILIDSVNDLYSAELQLKELRYNIGL